MPRYMLDTDTCSSIMKRSSAPVLRRLQRVPVTDVCMSVVTKSELLYGVEVSPRHAQDAAALAGVGVRFLSELERGKPTLQLGLAIRVLQLFGLELHVEQRGDQRA